MSKNNTVKINAAELWDKFSRTGLILDYLAYKRFEVNEAQSNTTTEL